MVERLWEEVKLRAKVLRLENKWRGMCKGQKIGKRPHIQEKIISVAVAGGTR